jgi:hypothetical protein
MPLGLQRHVERSDGLPLCSDRAIGTQSRLLVPGKLQLFFVSHF